MIASGQSPHPTSTGDRTGLNPAETRRSSKRIYERLTRLHPRSIDLSLGRMHRILAALGNPQIRVPPVVHIAGTNGKGSTLAFLRALYEASGKTVHTYTSPHLLRFHERIVLAGREVTESELSSTLEEVEIANDDEPITIFEIVTAAAFLLFSRHPSDRLLLETGLGGRLDATNVVETPLGGIITSVSIDHQEFLGSTLEKIAFEKAGIIKPGRPVIVAPQAEQSLAVIRRQARKLNAPLTVTETNGTFNTLEAMWDFQSAGVKTTLTSPRLFGLHQRMNAATALTSWLTLEGHPGNELSQIWQRANGRVNWGGRLSSLDPKSCAFPLPPGTNVWLDCCHNADAAQVVAQTFIQKNKTDPCPLHLVVGMLINKDAAGFFRAFQQCQPEVYCVPINTTAEYWPPSELRKIAAEAGLRARDFPNLKKVSESINVQEDGGSDSQDLLFCGSLYFAGDVLRMFGQG